MQTIHFVSEPEFPPPEGSRKTICRTRWHIFQMLFCSRNAFIELLLTGMKKVTFSCMWTSVLLTCLCFRTKSPAQIGWVYKRRGGCLDGLDLLRTWPEIRRAAQTQMVQKFSRPEVLPSGCLRGSPWTCCPGETEAPRIRRLCEQTTLFWSANALMSTCWLAKIGVGFFLVFSSLSPCICPCARELTANMASLPAFIWNLFVWEITTVSAELGCACSLSPHIRSYDEVDTTSVFLNAGAWC